MIVETLCSIGKYFLYFFIGYIIYLLYMLIVRPYLFWKGYQKYKNVYTEPNFVPFLGNFKYNLDNNKNGKAHYYHLVEKANEHKNYDMRVVLEGSQPVMFLVSCQAISEFVDMQPHKIDKTSSDKGLTKATPKALTKDPSTKYTMDRRKLMTSLLNLNRASSYIPGILGECAKAYEKLKDGEKQNVGHAVNCLIFGIIGNIFFGDDINKVAEKLRTFKNDDGTTEQIPIREMLIRLPRAFIMQLYNPLTTALPFLNNYDLVNPYKRDRENLECCREGLKEVLANTKDPKSVYGQLKGMKDYDPLVMFDDLMAFTVAAFETSAKTICSTLYFLK
jgi:cytochrome P450